MVEIGKEFDANNLEDIKNNVISSDEQGLCDFKEDFFNGVKIVAESTNEFLETSFLEKFTEQLLDVGELTSEFQPAHWSQRGIKVNGFSYEEESDVLNLFIAVFSNELSNSSLTQTEIDQNFNRIVNFFEKALQSKALINIDDSLDAYELALMIFRKQKNLTRIKYYLLSDKLLSERVQDIPSRKSGNIEYTFHVWDITRLFRMNSTSQKKEDIFINFEEITEKPVYCLPAHFATDTFISYLFILPGTILNTIYERYGAKLLEQNVRTFLQVRGNVNKGIRNTIIANPNRFFAYNNGLTATAEGIDIEENSGSYRIKSLMNLQIVNGGQTTASIFSAVKKDKADVSKVFVQVKLTIVNAKEAEEIVPKISEYANTQNKVNAADFFSNHPFHIKMQEFSRNTWAPATEGFQRESKWFYERARGQYLDAQSNKTVSEKKRFLMEYPKDRVFTKTDLAKYLSVWDEQPHIVARGAQYSFVEFAKKIQALWEKNQSYFSLFFYHMAISKVIIFERTEYIVSRADWYSGGFRAQVVAYTLALLAHKIKIAHLSVEYKIIWKNQNISSVMEKQINILAGEVYPLILNPPAGSANPSQWAKKEECWEKIKTIKTGLTIEFRKELVSEDFWADENRIAIDDQSADDKISLDMKIFNIPSEIWQKVLEFGKLNGISDKDVSLLKVAMNKMRLPSDKQAHVIWQLIERLKKIGLEFDGYFS